MFLANLCLIHDDIMCLSPVAHQLWPLCVLGSLFLSRLPQPDRWLQAIRNFFLRSLEEATRADMLAPSRRVYIGLHAHCVINPSLCCCLTSTSIPNLFSAKLGAIPHPGRDETARAPPQDCQVSLRYVSGGASWHAFQTGCATQNGRWGTCVAGFKSVSFRLAP